MRRISRRSLVAWLRAFGLPMMLLASSQAPGAPLAQAFVRTTEEGQALLFRRLGECYAVTPAHVLAGGLFANLVGGHDRRPQGDGDLLQTFGYDLALLHVTGALERYCGGSLQTGSGLEQRLAVAERGTLVSVNGDGSLSLRRVTVSDVGLLYLRVRPEQERDQLFKGLSGSLLRIDHRPAGILMSVDADTGEGRVLRFDRMAETLRPFFGATRHRRSRIDHAPDTSVTTAAGPTPKVVSWNAPPLDATHRAANLVAGVEKIWYAAAASFPLEVELELPGDKARAIRGVRLVGRGVRPVNRLPRDFEILVSSRSDGHWLPMASGSYMRTEQEKTVGFAPVRARRIMLRIYSNWGDATAVGLAAVEVLAAP